jgi:hypothetical protein
MTRSIIVFNEYCHTFEAINAIEKIVMNISSLRSIIHLIALSLSLQKQ